MKGRKAKGKQGDKKSGSIVRDKGQPVFFAELIPNLYKVISADIVVNFA